MSKKIFSKNVHYLNPFESEAMHSAHTFCIPRRCGYECHYRDKGYYQNAMKRGSYKRALFKYTISGCGVLRVNGKEILLEQGSAMLLVIPDDFIYTMPETSEKWEFIFISFWNQTAVTVIEKIIAENGNVFSLNHDGNAMKKAWELFGKFKNGTFSNKYSLSANGYDFLMHLCREATPLNAGNLDDEIFHKVSSYCFLHMERPITVDELAAHCSYSRWYFSKLFHRITGMTPSEYIISTKLDASLGYLQEGNISIKEIAFRCGFTDQGYFTRRFRARFGVTPTNFCSLK